MSFIVTRVREAGPVRYEKVGRLIPAENNEIRLIRDGFGEIFCIRKSDFALAWNGLSPDGMRVSDSGKRVILTGPSGEEYVVLTKQVRGMIEGWPKKKAAVFIEMKWDSR